MRSVVILALAVPMLGGCAHAQLRENTLRQTTTITELRYGQVLNNLALAAASPSALPYFAIVKDGTAQVQNNGTGMVNLSWDPAGLMSEMLGLSASHTVAEQWGLDPISEPERLEAMRCVFRYVTRGPGDDCSDCLLRLQTFKVDQQVAQIPPGFFCVGRKKDVPKDACYVGRHHHTYVWVTADGVDALTRLTLVILDIATVDLESLALPEPPTKVVERTYNEKGELTGRKEITKEPADVRYGAVPVPVVTSTPTFAPMSPLVKPRRQIYPFARPPITIPRPQ